MTGKLLFLFCAFSCWPNFTSTKLTIEQAISHTIQLTLYVQHSFGIRLYQELVETETVRLPLRECIKKTVSCSYLVSREWR